MWGMNCSRFLVGQYRMARILVCFMIFRSISLFYRYHYLFILPELDELHVQSMVIITNLIKF